VQSGIPYACKISVLLLSFLSTSLIISSFSAIVFPVYFLFLPIFNSLQKMNYTQMTPRKTTCTFTQLTPSKHPISTGNCSYTAAQQRFPRSARIPHFPLPPIQQHAFYVSSRSNYNQSHHAQGFVTVVTLLAIVSHTLS
jgi:hypothetical protein